MLENPGVLKVGHDLKSSVVVLARNGITLRSFDDVMLMSYVLDAGRSGHGLDELSRRHLGHTMLDRAELTGKGKAQAPFEAVDITRAGAFGAEIADVCLRLWRLFSARLVHERGVTVYQTLERPLVPVLARMESRGIAIVFGPVMDPQGVYGIGVYQAEDEAEMRDLLAHDPANGLLQYTVLPMPRAVVGKPRG